MKAILRPIAIVIAIAALLTTVIGQKYTGSPVTKDRLLRAVKSHQFAVPTLIKQIQISGVDFELTTSVEGELRSASANQQIIDACRSNYRYAGVKTGGRPPAPAPRDTTGEKYENLFYQGVQQLGGLRAATSANQVLEITRTARNDALQAISVSAARPEAYALVAATYIWERNFPESERYAQMSLDRGGDLTFPVYHLQPSPHVDILHIGRGFVTVESSTEFYQFNGAEITGVAPQQDYNYMGTRVAVLSFSTNKNGYAFVWYMAPGNTGTHEEAAMIMRLIQKYSMGGK